MHQYQLSGYIHGQVYFKVKNILSSKILFHIHPYYYYLLNMNSIDQLCRENNPYFSNNRVVLKGGGLKQVFVWTLDVLPQIFSSTFESIWAL